MHEYIRQEAHTKVVGTPEVLPAVAAGGGDSLWTFKRHLSTQQTRTNGTKNKTGLSTGRCLNWTYSVVAEITSKLPNLPSQPNSVSLSDGRTLR